MEIHDATRDFTEKDKVALQYRKLWENKFRPSEIEQRRKAAKDAITAFGVVILIGFIGLILILVLV